MSWTRDSFAICGVNQPWEVRLQDHLDFFFHLSLKDPKILARRSIERHPMELQYDAPVVSESVTIVGIASIHPVHRSLCRGDLCWFRNTCAAHSIRSSTREKNPPDIRRDDREESELSSNCFAFRDACDVTTALLSILLWHHRFPACLVFDIS